jgi:hypothetical protein
MSSIVRVLINPKPLTSIGGIRVDYPEDIAFEKLNAQHGKTMAAVSDVIEKAQDAEARLAELQRTLPDSVMKAAMGELSADTPSRIRREMQELRDVIENGALILESSSRATARYTGEHHKISRLRGYRRDYEALKAKVTEAGHATWSDTTTLRDLCLMLNGTHDEADAFLASLKPAAA